MPLERGIPHGLATPDELRVRAVSARAAFGAVMAAAATMLAIPATASAIGFQPYQMYPVGSRAESVAIADVTSDGRPDVLMTTSGYVDPDKDFKLLLFVQQPNGTLGPPQQFPTHA